MTNPRSSVAQVGGAAQCGLTLVELLIALGLALLLIAAVGAVYLGNNQTYRAAQDGARIQETGRYALDLIGRGLRQAGYAYISSAPSAPMRTFAGTPVLGVNTKCPTASPVTDMLTIQYEGIDGEQDCQAQNIAAGDIVQQTFFIQDNAIRCDAVCTNPDPDSPSTCSTSPTAPVPPSTCPDDGSGVELLENVEDLQILYGIDTSGDQSADRYTASPGNWNQVVSARVCLLIRSENQGSAPAGQTYFNCAGALGTAANDAARFTTVTTDTRLRRAFVATITLRNRITIIP